MRLFTMAGATKRRRRPHLPLVTIAAAALLLLAALPANAGIIDLRIDISKSFMTVSQKFDLSAIGAGVYSTAPQFPGSDTTSLYGQIFVDYNLTTIELLGGSQINFATGAPGAGGVPGVYAPFDPVVTDPKFPPVGTTPGGNYGLSIGSPVSLKQVEHHLRGDWVSGGPRPLSPGPMGTSTFPLVPGSDFLTGTAGRIAYSSALGTSTDSVVGFPLAALATAGNTPGTWDPLGGILPTLTIPIESQFTTLISLPGYPSILFPVTYFATGVIVAYSIPEPSSWRLLVCGVVGVLGIRWRRRGR